MLLQSTCDNGFYGEFGGRYVPEILVQALEALAQFYDKLMQDGQFEQELVECLTHYAGRATPLTEVPRFSEAIGGPRILLKREDLLHTGAHKLNNALGQCLLAKKMGKHKIIAETGAGQHGVATATACARLGLECEVFMGATDVKRQAPNVARMRLLGATVTEVHDGQKTLKEAVNAALRRWASCYHDTHYCLGSALGPDPFPRMVATFQSVIGVEARAQMLQQYSCLPSHCVACVGGGSNAIGLFSAFLEDEVALVGVEAGGKGAALGDNAARMQAGAPGVLHGSLSYVLQDAGGQIAPTHSISAGLDYPMIGPMHAFFAKNGRARYTQVGDETALAACKLLTQTEGILPALESSHALGFVMSQAKDFAKDDVVLINLSGRGDKDLDQLMRMEAQA